MKAGGDRIGPSRTPCVIRGPLENLPSNNPIALIEKGR